MAKTEIVVIIASTKSIIHVNRAPSYAKRSCLFNVDDAWKFHVLSLVWIYLKMESKAAINDVVDI